MADLSLKELSREVAAQRRLLDFFVSAAPFISTNYYPVGEVVDGKVLARSIASDLADAVAESKKIRAGE